MNPVFNCGGCRRHFEAGEVGMAEIIMRGAELADEICGELRPRVEALARDGLRPRLSILRVGERRDDLSYEAAVIRRCDSIGVDVENIALSTDTPEKELIAQIEELNANRRVSGIMLFRPLPANMDEGRVCAAIAPEKDVDGVTPTSMASVYSDGEGGFLPCTAQACMELLDKYGIALKGKRAVVVGRSLVIGKPLAMLLLKAGATVTLCHSKTERLSELTKSADLVAVAMGCGRAMGTEYFSEGQTVLDVGMNWDEAAKRLRGDVDFDAVAAKVRAISPVPSGVGAVTASILARHVAEAAERTEA